MILRGFLPAGWMPNLQGESPTALVVCTMEGAVMEEAGKPVPSKNDPRAHETCPFAGAVPLAPPSNEFAVLAAPELSESAAPRTLAAGFNAQAPPYSQPASRAPPALI